MERRTRSRLMRDEGEEHRKEEEEEPEEDRRSSTRKRKRVDYIYIDNNDNDDEEEKEEEEEEDDGENDPSHQNTNYQRIQDKRHLTVTCGTKKGILDVEKLGRSEECIKCEGHWFSPPAFEEYGGRSLSKKWKMSIFHDNKPLQFWLEQGYLTTKGYQKRGNGSTKKKIPLNGTTVSSSEESEIQSAEGTEEDAKDEEWLPGSDEPAVPIEADRLSAENGEEDVDSEVDTSKEEEDKMEKGEMEDEDMPAVADNDKSAFEETEARLIDVTPILQKELKVLIKRLTEFQPKSDSQSTSEEQLQKGGDHLTESLSVLIDCKYEDTGATIYEHEVAELQEIKLETSFPQTTLFSDMAEAPSSLPSTSCDLDTLDLDQLRREKIKMQIKVLKLQEEYYTQKIQDLKK